MIKSLSVIFPVFNEEKRLKDCFDDIKRFNLSTKIKKIEYIFIDDGSKDNSNIIINKFVKEQNKIKKKIRYKLIKLSKNSGKGGALMKGVMSVKNEWILTLDTDISVSLIELTKWLKKKYLKKNCIYFGSRNLKNSKVDYKIHRKIIGLSFIFICKILFNIKISDTQCGFKLYKKTMAQKIFRNLKEKGYVHDIEIVLKALNKKYEIVELPVTWVHKKNSKISFIKDSFKILSSLIVLKQKN